LEVEQDERSDDNRAEATFVERASATRTGKEVGVASNILAGSPDGNVQISQRSVDGHWRR